MPGAKRRGLLAARLGDGERGEVRGEGFRGECLNLQLQQVVNRNPEIDLTVRSVHDHRHAEHRSVSGADDVDGLLNSPASRNDILDHEALFTGCQQEPAAEDELAVVLFGKNKANAQLAGDFLADDESSHGGRNDGVGVKILEARGEGRSESFHVGHVLQGERALKVLAAVQTASEDEVAFQESSGSLKKFLDFVACHRY